MVESSAPTKDIPKKVLVFDLGHYWTKAFFLEVDDSKLKILAKTYLPTSSNDLNITFTQAFFELAKISKMKLWQEEALSFPLIITTELKLPEKIGQMAIKMVETKEALQTLKTVYQEKKGKHNFEIIDLGSKVFDSNLDIQEISGSLIFPSNVIDVENYIGNKRLDSFSLPVERREIELEQAIAKVGWQRLFPFSKTSSNFGCDLLLTGAVFAFSPEDPLTALIVLDNLPESVVTQAWVDLDLITPSLGAFLTVYPELNEFFSQDNFQNDLFKLANFKNLGTFVSLGKPGVIKVDFGYAQLQEVVVEEDQIVLLPVKGDQKVSFKIPFSGKKIQASLEGGELGIVFDGRVKPFRLTSGKLSQEKILHWRESLKKVEAI
ncbi:MAG: hypothetical protein M1150_01835 [Patescibacteria group bacterium]|nr:hypothetical protein [Patescibacteria group bacterium]